MAFQPIDDLSQPIRIGDIVIFKGKRRNTTMQYGVVVGGGFNKEYYLTVSGEHRRASEMLLGSGPNQDTFPQIIVVTQPYLIKHTLKPTVFINTRKNLISQHVTWEILEELDPHIIIQDIAERLEQYQKSDFVKERSWNRTTNQYDTTYVTVAGKKTIKIKSRLDFDRVKYRMTGNISYNHCSLFIDRDSVYYDGSSFQLSSTTQYHIVIAGVRILDSKPIKASLLELVKRCKNT